MDGRDICPWKNRIEALEELLDIFGGGAIQHGDGLDFGEVFDKGGQAFDGFGPGAGALVEDDFAVVEEQEWFDALERADGTIGVFETARLFECIDRVDKKDEVCLPYRIGDEALDFGRRGTVLDGAGGARDNRPQPCRE